MMKVVNLGSALGSYTRPSSDIYDPSFDKKIRELRPDWFVNSADENKIKLLEIAQNGESRPRLLKHPLGSPLVTYTRKTHTSYDQEFDKKIRDIRPDWFISTSDVANAKKKQLLEMAESGLPKPTKNELMSNELSNYTKEYSNCYDPEFDKEIRALRPDWFVGSSCKNKKLLLDLAKDGGPRPSKHKNKLGRYLGEYTNINRVSYDPEFTSEIRKIRPDWFTNSADENKTKLLNMAKNGESRPNKHKNRMGQYLTSYTRTPTNGDRNGSSYDPDFDKEIRALRPDWFVSKTDQAQDKKEQLLKIAKEGKNKPKHRSKLEQSLGSYTRKSSSCYDIDFDKKIRILRPDWFVTQHDKVNNKKKRLVQIAKSGKSRPKYSTDIGRSLTRYMNVNEACYDAGFAKQIRKLRPDWFKR